MTVYKYLSGVRQASPANVEEAVAVTGHDAVYFLDTNGTNNGGQTWANAFTSLATALASMSGSYPLLLVGPGTYDINTTGDPTITRDLQIKGLTANQGVIFSNGHASATSVLKFTGLVDISDVTIDCGTANNGLIISGTNANGSRLYDIYFEGENLASAADLLQLAGGVKYVHVEHCRFHGETTNGKGIHTNQSLENVLMHNQFHECSIGIHFDHTDDESNLISQNRFRDCAQAIQIDTGADSNHFDNCIFSGNTANVSDSGTGTSFVTPSFALPKQIIVPPVPSNVKTLTGGAQDTLGAWVVIDDGTSMTTPYRIERVVLFNASDGNAFYHIVLGKGAPASEIEFARIGIDGGGRNPASAVLAMDEWLPAGTPLNARCMSSSGAGDTIGCAIEIILMG